MITYTEKGAGLHEAILAAGHWLEQRNGVWVSSNDSAVQAIINSYNPLPNYKTAKINAIKADGLSRIQALFPAIRDFEDLALIRELWLSILVAARSATPTWQRMIDIYTAGKNAISAVNAATTQAQVDAVTPAWPQ